MSGPCLCTHTNLQSHLTFSCNYKHVRGSSASETAEQVHNVLSCTGGRQMARDPPAVFVFRSQNLFSNDPPPSLIWLRSWRFTSPCCLESEILSVSHRCLSFWGLCAQGAPGLQPRRLPLHRVPHRTGRGWPRGGWPWRAQRGSPRWPFPRRRWACTLPCTPV